MPPRRKQRRNKRSSPPRPDLPELPTIVDSDNSSVPSSLADDYISNLLNQPDTDITDLPSPSPSPRKNTSRSRPSSSSSSDSSPSRKSKPQPRKIVLEDAMAAFQSFSQKANAQTSHACRPSPDSKHRLALHRSAELMGATSTSMGSGKGRFVIIDWPPGKRVPISEAKFERGVTKILDELMPEKRKRRSGGRERQREFARQLRLARMWPDDGDVGEFGQLEICEETLDERTGRNAENADKVGRGNLGFDMLEKMGWSEGTGLGADRDGRVDPIMCERRMRRAGLGSI